MEEKNSERIQNEGTRKSSGVLIKVLLILAVLLLAGGAYGWYYWNLPEQKTARALKSADELMESGDVEGAAAGYEEALAIDEDNIPAMEGRVRTMMILAEEAEASAKDIPARSLVCRQYEEIIDYCEECLEKTGNGSVQEDSRMTAAAETAQEDGESASASGQSSGETAAAAETAQEDGESASAAGQSSGETGVAAETAQENGESASAAGQSSGETAAAAETAQEDGESASAAGTDRRSSETAAESGTARESGETASEADFFITVKAEAADKLRRLRKEIAESYESVSCVIDRDDRSGKVILTDGEEIPFSWYYDLVRIDDEYYPLADRINTELQAARDAFFNEGMTNPSSGISGTGTDSAGSYFDYVGVTDTYSDNGILSIRMAEIRVTGNVRAGFFRGITYRLSDGKRLTLEDVTERTDSGLRQMLTRRIRDWFENEGYSSISMKEVEEYVEETASGDFKFFVGEGGKIFLVLDQEIPFFNSAGEMIEIPLD